jgi:hypothetical protein
MLWDTLKIDAQGADGLVVIGAGGLLAHFACIVGEFDTRGYEVRHKDKPNFHGFLLQNGFVRVNSNIYANVRFKSKFASRSLLCGASDVKVPWAKALRSINRALGGRPVPRSV